MMFPEQTLNQQVIRERLQRAQELQVQKSKLGQS